MSVRPNEERLALEARKDSRGHRVEAAVEALAVAAIAEKRREDIFHDLRTIPEPASDGEATATTRAKIRAEGREAFATRSGRRVTTLTLRFGLCCARRKPGG